MTELRFSLLSPLQEAVTRDLAQFLKTEYNPSHNIVHPNSTLQSYLYRLASLLQAALLSDLIQVDCKKLAACIALVIMAYSTACVVYCILGKKLKHAWMMRSKLRLQGGAAVTGEAAKEHPLDLKVCQFAGLIIRKQLKVPVKQLLHMEALPYASASQHHLCQSSQHTS